MQNHYHDANGVYTVSAPANPDSLPPPNALRLPPPRRDGYWPVLAPDGTEWTLAPDHRGRQGWVDGKKMRISRPGPLPEGWSDTAPEAVDARGYKERRRSDFAAEADPLLLLILARTVEAEALKRSGEEPGAQEEEDKIRSLLCRYLAVKSAIRARHRPTENENSSAAGGGGLLYRTASGVYHAPGCRYTAFAGEWLKPEEIMRLSGKQKACAVCDPGPLEI